MKNLAWAQARLVKQNVILQEKIYPKLFSWKERLAIIDKVKFMIEPL